jgi:hypothetical protein
MKKPHLQAVCLNLRNQNLPEAISASACNGHYFRPFQECPGAIEPEGTALKLNPSTIDRPSVRVDQFLGKSSETCDEFISCQS